MSNAVAVSLLAVMSDAEIEAEFEKITGELASRIEACVARARDPDEARQELWAFCWRDFRQAAIHDRILPAGQLVWFGWRWLKAGRSIAGHESVTEPHSPLCQRRGRARVIHLSALSCSKRQQVLPDSTIQNITEALTTSEKDQPDVRAAMRLDWAAFSRQLPVRLRKILRWLSIGATKTWIARRLNVTNGRVSQLLTDGAEDDRPDERQQDADTHCADGLADQYLVLESHFVHRPLEAASPMVNLPAGIRTSSNVTPPPRSSVLVGGRSARLAYCSMDS
ncbi:MAG: hypothetical protein NTW87_09170 [Planctomycetota bacterium]|nr:hypothetical protein [Planctomycetota bacterium]